MTRTNTITGRRGAATKRPVAAGRKKRKPGRPEGTSTVRETILDTAERMFADLGYAGTTLREIAEDSKVTQALINYYFGSKFGLFEEVYLRRAVEIAAERMVNLAALNDGWATSGKPPALRDIVRSFLLPTLALRATPQGRNFLRLQSRLHTEPPQISYKLRTNAYDESTRSYVLLLQKLRPELTALDAHWRITMMIGTYLYAFSDTHRMEEMVGGTYDPGDSAEIMEQVTRFVTGGLQAD